MRNCTTTSLYESVEACPGEKNLPGLRRRLYFILKSWIVVWPVLIAADAAGATMEKMSQLVGDFTLAADKFWQFIDLKDESSNVTYESVGENGSKLFLNKVNAIVAGMKDAVKGFARQANNDDLVFLYQNRDGSFCLVGNEMFKTSTSPSGDTGSEATGAITSTFDIQAYDECPVPTYLGKILIDATHYIDAADGKTKAVEEDNEGDESNSNDPVMP